MRWEAQRHGRPTRQALPAPPAGGASMQAEMGRRTNGLEKTGGAARAGAEEKLNEGGRRERCQIKCGAEGAEEPQGRGSWARVQRGRGWGRMRPACPRRCAAQRGRSVSGVGDMEQMGGMGSRAGGAQRRRARRAAPPLLLATTENAEGRKNDGGLPFPPAARNFGSAE